MTDSSSLSFRWQGLLLALGLLAGVAVTLRADNKQQVDPDHARKMAQGLEVFKKHIRPLLEQKCLRCHGGKATEAELEVVDRQHLLKGGMSGPAIIPGKGKDSLLYKVVAHLKEPHMPQGSKKLPEEQIAHLARWIDLGAPFDRPLLEKEDLAAWTKKVVPESERKHWAYQPLRRSDPPAVRDTSWPRNSLDRFILAKLEAAGIAPNPEASPRQWLRRVYLDLTGLPPSPEEVHAFLKDTSPKARAALVDRLLSSPRYGERWARHWLDLARFAESHGFEHDYDRPTAYHYRDFVIQALNQGMPYNRFVQWQIAGDELAPSDPLALTATGFLAAGVHSTQITKNEVEKHRYDELDDMVATIGTSMLGLTIGCARCHDHKYDAIPQADYYRLVSAFTTTVRSEIDLRLDSAEYRKALAAWETEHAPLLAALRRYEAEQLPQRFAEWEKGGGVKKLSGWLLPEVAASLSQGGATFEKLDDGSILVTGKNPRLDVHTFTLHTDLKEIRALRLEALTHPSLVKGGPGRAANGNFALSDIKVSAAPRNAPNKAVPIKLIRARATFQQRGLPVSAAIDADARSAWAVDPQFGKDHAAIFEPEKPFGFAEGTIVTVSLSFLNNDKHAIGRPRFSLCGGPAIPELTDPSVPAEVLRLLQLAPEKRTTQQQQRLLQWFGPRDSDWARLNSTVQAHRLKAPRPRIVKALISTEGMPAVRLHTQGEDFLPQTHYLRRGDPEQKQGVAEPGYLQVLINTSQKEKHWAARPPQGSRTSFRRAAFAAWISDVEHGAGHLLARVIVNRLWQRHLGRGIVATPSDFGTRGEPPSHPELLDWLAQELIRNGWQLKPIHKLIVTSATYAQSSHRDPKKEARDRDNRLFWRRPALRLEAEAVRDAILSVSGELDLRMYGPGTLSEAMKRRSIYFTIKRSQLIPMLQVFDAPDALGGIPERPTTTVAPQALLLLNNPNVRAWVKSFARRIGPEGVALKDAIAAGYEIALSRPATREELADSLAFVTEQEAGYKARGQADARLLALSDFCQVLICLNEFIYVD